jgi:phosphoribosylformimino-5-aminoimidazole carboxamide ribotide isomerase
MIAIPAVDLREGACVQLVGGSYAEERVRLTNPMDVVRSWEYYGFHRLHLVDLDAATGHGSNLSLIRDILGEANVPVQVGGGVRSDERVEELLAAGAAQVIVGTRAIEERDWLAELAQRHPGQIIVACDVRERRVTTRGWAHTLPVDILDVVEELNGLPLGGLLVTAVHKEGQLRGTDLPLMEDVAESSQFPVYASGGVTSIDDLRALEHRGIAGAVVGMALYTGAMDPVVVAGEFGG